MHTPRLCRRLALAGLGLFALPLLAAESLLVKNGIFLTVKPGAEPSFVGYMTVGADGRITAVEKGAAPATLTADKVIDAAGKFVAPGFISAHSHLGNAQFRGLGHTATLYGWSDETSKLNRHTTTDDAYWFSVLGAHEFLRNGITTVFDLTRAAPAGSAAAAETAGDPLAVSAFEFNQVRGKVDGGIRFINASPLGTTGTPDEIIGRFGRFLAKAKETYGGNPLLLKMAISGIGHRGTSRESVLLEARAMKQFGVMNQSHYLESPDSVPEQQAKFQWYEEAGMLGPDFIFGHFIHTTPAMVAALGKAGASMSWQPLSNGRLASGIADIPAYRAAGIRVGMGLDSNACTDSADPFENIHVGMSLIRASTKSAEAMPVADLLYLHTLGAAEVMRVADQVGSLEPGKFADFLIVDPRAPYTGPVLDPVAHYMLTIGLRNLKQVYVGGKLMIDDEKFAPQDEAPLLAEIESRMTRIIALAAVDAKRAPR